MIHISGKNYNRAPKRLLCLGAKKQIRQAAANQSGSICTGNYYRDDTVRNLLKAYSIGKRKLAKADKPKCYYCESRGEAMLQLEVEHYRPKDQVHSIDLTNGQTHSGYYWLANEWSNLLLACRACNGNSAKGTRFPIANNIGRISHRQPVDANNVLNRTICKLNSVELLAEGAILLNPEFDHPEQYLTFTNTGRLTHQPGQIRGKSTIEILKLNRDPLLIARQDILNEFKSDINLLVYARMSGRITSDQNLATAFELICQKIIARTKVNQAYTLWGIYMNANINNLIVNKIDPNYQHLFLNAYRNVLNNP